MASPGASTAVKTSHPRSPSAPRFRPSHFARLGADLVVLVGQSRVDEHECGRLAALGLVQPLFAQLASLGQPAVASQLTHSEVVVEEDVVAAFLLYPMVAGAGAPPDKCFFVAPSGQRQ